MKDFDLSDPEVQKFVEVTARRIYSDATLADDVSERKRNTSAKRFVWCLGFAVSLCCLVGVLLFWALSPVQTGREIAAIVILGLVCGLFAAYAPGTTPRR